ncbi:MAG: DUF294 nucleotidyltransferase-like domain-containing protein [Bacteroidota bacterium]
MLSHIHPFSQLPPEEVAKASSLLIPRVFEPGELAFEQDVTPLTGLFIIESGRVEKFFREGNSENYREVFGAGETFGAMSLLLNNATSVRSVRSLEATTLKELPAAVFRELFDTYPAFSDYYTTRFGHRMLNSGYAQWLLKPEGPSLLESGEKAYRKPIREVFSRTLNVCTPETTLYDAARSMTLSRKGYVLVKQEAEFVGVLTDVDLRNGVVINGTSTDKSVSTLMKQPVLTIPIEAFLYEAILQMFRHKIHHLFVRENDEIVGMVTLEKLLATQAKSPFIFVQSVEEVQSLEEMVIKWKQVPHLVNDLLAQGARPETANHVISNVADIIAKKIVASAVEFLGPPPARFVFMALGSEGRKEQTLFTDQDNALIYEDVEGEEARKNVREYFLKLGNLVSDRLHEVGFNYCEGGLMAKNPKWNHSLSHWKESYRLWIKEPFTDTVLKFVTFFDCSAVYGDGELLDNLKNYIFEQLKRPSQLFFYQLTQASLMIKPPLTFFNNFELFTQKESKDKVLDIKKAMLPLADFARINALKHEIREINTAERLKKLLDAGLITPAEHTELMQAYYFMMRLRLQHQSDQLINKKVDANNLISPGALSKIERVTLREVFKLVQKYQTRMSNLYGVPKR